MDSNLRQPPNSNATTLASLTNEHFQEPIARSQEQTRSQNIRSKVRGGWVMARQSRIPSRAWNRQSILVFTDFNNCENDQRSRPRMAEQNSEDLEDSTSQPDDVRPSRAWNRQSILVFTDFNNCENDQRSRPRMAEQNSEDLEDSTSQPDDVRSSASSSYSLDKELSPPPYHVFTLAKKKQLVYIVSLAGLFSPLSSNIYFPALGQIATVCLDTNC